MSLSGGRPMLDFPRSLPDFKAMFPDDRSCAAYLFGMRWPKGFECPACGGTRAWALRRKGFTWECRNPACRKQTSVTAGLVMHGSKLSLTTWFWAAYLMASHSNGMSALQLKKQLGLGSYESAWLLCQKLRRAMVDPERARLDGEVEIDETFVPYRTHKDPIAGGQGRSPQGKIMVVGAVQIERYVKRTVSRKTGKIVERVVTSPGRIRLKMVRDGRQATLHAFVRANVAPGSTIVTDDFASYRGLDPEYRHVPHTIGTMAAHVKLPWIHRVFSLQKRWGLGVYHGLRKKHFQRYLEEFEFRFNRRVSRPATFHRILGIAVKIRPVTYRQIVEGMADVDRSGRKGDPGTSNA